MKKESGILIALTVFLISGCSYHLIKLTRKRIYLKEVRSEVSFLTGIEPEIASALLRNLGRRGISFTTDCPEVTVDLLSVNPGDYYYTPSGYIARITGVVKYRVKITPCHGKSFSRVVGIPLTYTYYSHPYGTEASMRSSIVNGIDKLSEKIVELLNGDSFTDR